MRTSHFIQFGLITTLFMLVSCGGRKTEPLHLNLSVRNNTKMALDRMKVEWDGPYIPGGIMPPGKSSTAVGVEIPKSDSATLSFVEEDSRKSHSIRLDV